MSRHGGSRYSPRFADFIAWDHGPIIRHKIFVRREPDHTKMIFANLGNIV